MSEFDPQSLQPEIHNEDGSLNMAAARAMLCANCFSNTAELAELFEGERSGHGCAFLGLDHTIEGDGVNSVLGAARRGCKSLKRHPDVFADIVKHTLNKLGTGSLQELQFTPPRDQQTEP